MNMRDTFPEFTPYTFGTMSLGRKTVHFQNDLAVARAAMDADVWFHTSQEYGAGGTFMVLRHAFDADRANVPKCIFKIRCDSADFIRFDVEDALRRLNLDRIDVAQLCKDNHEKREIVDDFLAQGPMWETCCDLKDRGLVGNFVMEVFAQFSADAMRAVENDLFEGYILYYNLLDRQANNPLFDLLEAKNVPLLALRTLSGAVADPGRAVRRAETSPADPIVQRRRALEPLYEKSRCATWLEFAVRFILGRPQVQTTIGGTANLEHLRDYLETVKAFKPLDPDIIREIRGLHRDWWQ